MGHLFSRAIKRFTQCSGGRNQLPSGSGSHEQQATTTDASQRDQDLGRQTVQSIPVGQSIDSAEYAAFKTSSSTFDRKEADDSNLAVTTSQGQTAAASANVNVNDDKENENITRQQKQVDQDDQLVTNDQNKPEVEEAVIKIQALVRGHLTRKALKDAQQQAAVVPPNTLGQSQFDEESLRNPPNAVFSNASPANSTSNNNNNQHQQSSKPSNNRVPPLESIAEDVESANQSATNSTRGKRSPLSPLNQSSGSASDSTGEPHSTSPSNEAHVSIDLHCDTPASASIDIMDHTSKPMPGIAAVLHHKNPADNTPTASQLRQPEQTRQTLPNAFDLPNLVTFESPVSDQHQINSSSLPSSPPHINLAATTNSHSIDSAEAAAIRIQSAFRGYHTRKHSPYRRRSPANATSPLARPVNQVNGNESNGQPKRSFLRQQDATIVDEDDDEGVEGCERLAGVTDAQEPSGGESASFRLTNVGERDNEENRQSRQRHRADEATTAISDSAGQTSVKNILGLSIDEISNTDDQSTVKELRSDESRGRQTSRADDQTTVLTGATNKAAVLTGAETDEHLEPSEQLEEGWTNKLSTGDGGAGARWSTSVDTDSSNLGAALSLNEDLSEGISQASQGHEALQRLSQQRESVGAAIEAVDESVGDFGSVLDGEPTFLSKDSNSQQQIDELNKATSQLEAALDEGTDKEADYYGNQLAENLADKILEDETEENLNELESDDIERRHPSGLISQDSTKTPASSELDQPALAASESLDQEAQEPMDRSQRLDVVSPDEAIGSGESSPVPAVLQDGNSSDEGQDSDQDQEGQHQQEQGTAKTDNNQQGVNGGKSKKRNRNKKKGKK